MAISSETARYIEGVATSAAFAAKRAHDELGDAGLEMVHKNQHGETALAVDIACEKAVITAFENSGLPIHVRSEEHGAFDVGKSEPRYLLMLDGIDGTAVYKESKRTGGYGTMFALFKGLDARYRDCITARVVQQGLGRLVESGLDGSVTTMGGMTQVLRTRRRWARLVPDCRIRVDEYFEINRKTFSDKLRPDFDIEYTKCSAMSYVDVAIAQADLACECTRKGNLEIAVAYRLIKAAGGAFVDLDGRDIGDRPILTWGQDSHIPVIAAATRDLAWDLLKYLKTRP